MPQPDADGHRPGAEERRRSGPTGGRPDVCFLEQPLNR